MHFALILLNIIAHFEIHWLKFIIFSWSLNLDMFTSYRFSSTASIVEFVTSVSTALIIIAGYIGIYSLMLFYNYCQIMVASDHFLSFCSG